MRGSGPDRGPRKTEWSASGQVRRRRGIGHLPARTRPPLDKQRIRTTLTAYLANKSEMPSRRQFGERTDSDQSDGRSTGAAAYIGGRTSSGCRARRWSPLPLDARSHDTDLECYHQTGSQPSRSRSALRVPAACSAQSITTVAAAMSRSSADNRAPRARPPSVSRPGESAAADAHVRHLIHEVRRKPNPVERRSQTGDRNDQQRRHIEPPRRAITDNEPLEVELAVEARRARLDLRDELLPMRRWTETCRLLMLVADSFTVPASSMRRRRCFIRHCSRNARASAGRYWLRTRCRP